MRPPSEEEPSGGATGTKGAGGLFTAPHATGEGNRDQGGAGGGVTLDGGIEEGLLSSAVWGKTIATVAQVRPVVKSCFSAGWTVGSSAKHWGFCELGHPRPEAGPRF